MKQRTTIRPKSRSRRRRGGRGCEVFSGFIMFLLTLLLIAVLIVAGVFGYRFWKGSRIKDTPLETSREVVPETLSKLY